jgi:hypothetical protein
VPLFPHFPHEIRNRASTVTGWRQPGPRHGLHGSLERHRCLHLHMNIENLLLISWKVQNNWANFSLRCQKRNNNSKKALSFIESRISILYLQVPILSQPNPVHINTPCVFKINLIILFTCMPTLYHKAFLPEVCTHFSSLPCVLCATSISSSGLIANKGYVWGWPNSLKSASINQHIHARKRTSSKTIIPNTHISFMSTYQRQRPTCHRSPPSTDAATHATSSNNTIFTWKFSNV